MTNEKLKHEKGAVQIMTPGLRSGTNGIMTLEN